MSRSRPSWVLGGAAAGLYLWLCATTVNGVGVVGEVAASWALSEPPTVLTTLSPPEAVAPPAWGPFVAAQARPLERLVLGPISLPLAVNTYTGGLADWPARLAAALAGGPGPAGIVAGTATHVLLGLLLLVLARRFLRFHGTPGAADVAGLLLASDWCFVFYRKVLGGTEILLQAAALLVLWALWSRRWKGGVHGTLAIAVGVGLGLHAKATFVATLAAFTLAALLMRWDRAPMKPPRRASPWALVVVPLLLTSPLLLAAAHHAALPPGAEVPSHDTLALQLARLSSPAPAREGAMNLAYFLGDPLAWFGPALRAQELSWLAPLRWLGFVGAAVGILQCWREREVSPSAGLLRFLSVAVPLQIGLLWAANHDLHHLAQATVPLCLLLGLAVDRAAGVFAPPTSLRRTALNLLLAAPLVLAGSAALRDTDPLLDTLPRSTFTTTGQAELVGLVRGAGATRVVTSDYEVYGMAELRVPEVRWVHTWGAMARGERDAVALLKLAEGGWYLSLRPTAAMVYNWRPGAGALRAAATEAGVELVPAGSLRDTKGVWAELWRVEPGATIPTGSP